MVKWNFGNKLLVISILLLIAVLVIFCTDLTGLSIPVNLVTAQKYEAVPLYFSNSSVIICLVGDCSGYNIVKSDSKQSDPLGSIRPLINQSDIFLFNMECVILRPDQLNSAVKYPNQSSFISSPDFVGYLKVANITVANMANNHILDGGATGIEETQKSFSNQGIYYLGAGINAKEACQPLILTVKGTRIGFLSYNQVNPSVFSAGKDNPGTGSFLTCNVTKNIRYLKERSDVVIVSLHWGPSWSDKIDDYQIATARQLSDAGADLVIGHHPHVLQAIGRYNNTLVLYSLGNFILNPDYEMPADAHTSVIAFIEIRDGKVKACDFYPVILDNRGLPQSANGKKSDTILSHLADLSEHYDIRIINEKGVGIIRDI
jgi:hypothetical protein